MHKVSLAIGLVAASLSFQAAAQNEAGFHLYSPDVESDGEIDA